MDVPMARLRNALLVPFLVNTLHCHYQFFPQHHYKSRMKVHGDLFLLQLSRTVKILLT